jgi:hypothetical protein
MADRDHAGPALRRAWEKTPRLGVLSSFTVAQVEAMAAAAPMFRHTAGDA